MFEDSLFATNARRAPQRGLAAVLSFGIQIAVVGVLVLVPLIYTDAVPLGGLKNYVEIPPPPGRVAPQQRPPQQARVRRTSSELVGNTVVQPRVIPRNTPQVDDHNIAPAPNVEIGDVIGGGDPSGRNSIMSVITSDMRIAPPKPPVRTEPRITRVSGGVIEGLLIQKIMPPYPSIAKQTHTQGAVVMHAIIGRDGTVQHLELVSGHPLLVQAAMNAVRQWRYRPYMLSNEPVEVDTQITVNFILGN